jgi:ribosomal protein S18 acetylase RimI-like enzyme
MIEIVELKEKDFPNGKKVRFSYDSEKYYDVISENNASNWSVHMELKEFDKPVHKSMVVEIFQDYKPDLECFALLKNDTEAGIISFNHEKWNNVVRIWDLYIQKEYQRIGIGRRLMDIALHLAKELEARALVLETQTSNYPAIQFYLKYGFRFRGIDTINYTNQDILRKEVRLEMGLLLNED